MYAKSIVLEHAHSQSTTLINEYEHHLFILCSLETKLRLSSPLFLKSTTAMRDNFFRIFAECHIL